MKKLFVLFFAVVVMSSCEVCQTCTCVTYQNGTQIGSTSQEVCDKDNIKALEGTTTSQSGSVVVTTKCDCK